MKRTAVIAIAVLVLFVTGVTAQDAAKEIRGKVYLKGGQAYEGVIRAAEFGVVPGAGIGPNRAMNSEYMAVKVNGDVVKVPVGDIATVEADWQQLGQEGAKKWQIASLTITRKDGTKVTGGVDWMLHESTAEVLQADGTIAVANAFPTLSADFDPSQLLVKIELGSAVMAGGEGPAGGGTTPGGEGTAPGGTAPGGTTPGEGPTTGGTAPGGVTPGPTTTGETPTPGGGTAGGNAAVITITIICPHCGEKITIELPVIAKGGG